MAGLILTLGIIAVIVGKIINKRGKYNDSGEPLMITGRIVYVVFGFVVLCLVVSLSASIPMDEQIEMYETENNKIETQIESVVENYKDFEYKTFNDLKGNMSALITLYPELKSNTLVEEQIKIYVNNNKKIKELKEEKLHYKIAKWWLYFGG